MRNFSIKENNDDVTDLYVGIYDNFASVNAIDKIVEWDEIVGCTPETKNLKLVHLMVDNFPNMETEVSWWSPSEGIANLDFDAFEKAIFFERHCT